MLDTKGGPITDSAGRVLDAKGEPVAGLYGAGNCVASPSGKAYWAGGATIGPALTFGFLAGRSAAAEPRRLGAPVSAATMSAQ
jgi:predicted oxidoreductase